LVDPPVERFDAFSCLPPVLVVHSSSRRVVRFSSFWWDLWVLRLARSVVLSLDLVVPASLVPAHVRAVLLFVLHARVHGVSELHVPLRLSEASAVSHVRWVVHDPLTSTEK